MLWPARDGYLIRVRLERSRGPLALIGGAMAWDRFQPVSAFDPEIQISREGHVASFLLIILALCLGRV